MLPAQLPSRRFGRTELAMPVLSLGCMRFQHSWTDVPPDQISAASQANLRAILEKAVAAGFHHIETARHYGTSERQLGWLLDAVPDPLRILQTKVPPQADPAVFPDIKESLRGYIDQLDFFLSPQEIALLNGKLAAIPDAETFVHFDLHSSNIMIRDGEPVIIDMGDMSRGHALFDVGLLATIYGVPELELCELATKIPQAVGLALWENFLPCYFADRPAGERALFEANKHFLASMRLIYTITFLPALRDRCASLIKEVLMPRIAA
jgi:hypothetical protein